MTIGADTEYDLPGEREPKNFLELDDSLCELINFAREQVADATSAEEIYEVVHNLNDALHAEGILGRTARLESDFATLITSDITVHGVEDEEGLESKTLPMLTASRCYEGVLIGCDASALGPMAYELVYRLELPLNTKRLQFRTVIAAVDDSKVAVEVIQATPRMLSEVSHPAITFLRGIESEVVQAKLDAMIDIIDYCQEVDADTLKELGLLATEMLAQPAFADDEAARKMVANLFVPLIEEDGWYRFEGVDFSVTKTTDGYRQINVDSVEGVGQIYATALVEDFDFTEATEETAATLSFKGSKQLAFIIFDDNNVEHVIPLRRLTSFTEDTEPEPARRSQSDECTTARNQFLQEYPDVFSDQPFKLGKSIIKKYFKK